MNPAACRVKGKRDLDSFQNEGGTAVFALCLGGDFFLGTLNFIGGDRDDMAKMKKEFVEHITSQAEDFSLWYTDVSVLPHMEEHVQITARHN